MSVIDQENQDEMPSETSQSASNLHDELTVFHRNPSNSYSSTTNSVAHLTRGVHRSAQKASRSAQKTAHVAKRGARKTAKVTKVGIDKSVHAGRSICLRYPRSFSLLFGVFLPLWLIIFISLGFGYFLSLVEAPNEGKN